MSELRGPTRLLRVHPIEQGARLEPLASGVIYARDPWLALATDGMSYLLKNTDPLVVLAEVLASQLADLLGIPTPRWGYYRNGNHVHYASRFETYSIRERAEVFFAGDQIANLHVLGQIAVFDQWIANPDRNEGNVLLVSHPSEGKARLMAIDHERARLLRGDSYLQLPEDPGAFLPHGFLRRYLVSSGGFDQTTVDRIERLTEEEIETCVRHVRVQAGNPLSVLNCEYADRCCQSLFSRARHIRDVIARADSALRARRLS